jgi:hypothetical protein
LDFGFAIRQITGAHPALNTQMVVGRYKERTMQAIRIVQAVAILMFIIMIITLAKIMVEDFAKSKKKRLKK